MKTNFLCTFFIFLACSSCVTFKQFDNRAKAARDSSCDASIIRNNGQRVTGNALKHKNYDLYDHNLVRVINSNNAFTIDGQKYNDSDIIAFQDAKAFHKRFHDLFLIRLVKSKINLYYFDNTGYDKTYTYHSSGSPTINSVNNRTSTFFLTKTTMRFSPLGLVI